MNYYPFNIGDYSRDTRHLSWDEDLAYRRCLDAYYATEKPLPEDKRALYRLVMASTEAQREAVDTVVHEFFELTGDGWRHFRCDAEISKATEKGISASKAAKARWEKERSEAELMQTQCGRNADASDFDANASIFDATQDPRPKTQDPIPKTQDPVPKKTITRERAIEQVSAIFDHWRSTMKHPHSKLDDKRRKVIRSRLDDGYSPDELCRAITGCSKTPWNMGANPNGQRYDSLELILRNAEQVDRFIANAEAPPVPQGKQAQVEAINRAAVDQFCNESGVDMFGGRVIDGEASHA